MEYFWFLQAQKIHSLSEELDEAKGTIRTLNKRNESDIVSDCFNWTVRLFLKKNENKLTCYFRFVLCQDCVNNLMESVKGLKKNLGEKDVSSCLC